MFFPLSNRRYAAIKCEAHWPLKDITGYMPMPKVDAIPKQWCVYMVRCDDGTLYTGITNDIERRISEHNSDKGGAKYTRPRQPVELVYMAIAESRSAAAKREYQIKRMPLIEKRRLVNESRANTSIKKWSITV
jgi:putative endonuclease